MTGLLLLCAANTHEEWILTLFCFAILILAAVLVTYSYRTWAKRQLQTHLAALADVDVMDGLEFEEYVASLLRLHGYKNVVVTPPVDYGVDIIAERNGERWGVQAKRYTGRVGDWAVKQVVGGLKYYHCSRAMVVTNSTYTSRALKIGKSNDCVLIDRIELSHLISDASSAS